MVQYLPGAGRPRAHGRGARPRPPCFFNQGRGLCIKGVRRRPPRIPFNGRVEKKRPQTPGHIREKSAFLSRANGWGRPPDRLGRKGGEGAPAASAQVFFSKKHEKSIKKRKKTRKKRGFEVIFFLFFFAGGEVVGNPFN